MKILDGKRTSQKILDDISSKVERIVLDGKRVPRLDLILVGEDFASVKYVQIKEQKAQ